MALSCQKSLFDLDPQVHYLNGAYMSPLLRRAAEAGIQNLLRKCSPNQISAADFFTDSEHLRELFAQLVNAHSSDEVAFIPAVSYGMAIIAKNLRAKKGQKIIIAEAQFPSNVYPWQRLAEENGLDLQIIQMPSHTKGRAQLWNERIVEAIDDRTAMVTIGHVHWATGTRFDLKEISAKVHRSGGLMVVDGTQSVGVMPIDVQEFQLDALICAGYKWLMGPYSLGYTWLGKAFIDGSPLEESWINRLGSEDFSSLVDYQPRYQQGARRFDVGEHSNFILVPMGIVVLKQLLDWGAANMQDYMANLTRKAELIWEGHGFLLDNHDERGSHLFGMQLPAHVPSDLLQQKLKVKNVTVSVRGNFLRVSPNVYNDESDIAALTKVLTSF